LSNLIKGYSVKYADDTKKIDSNDAADKLAREYMDKYIAENIALKQIDFNEVAKGLENVGTDEDDFVPGIGASEVIVEDEQSSAASQRLERINEEVSERLDEVKELEDRIKSLQEEEDRVLAETKERADAMIEQAKKQAQDESDLIKEGARNEGYDEGMSRAKGELDARSRQLDERAAALEENYKKQVSELEPAFVEIAIKIVEKLTGIYASDKEGIIGYLVESAFEDIPRSEEYIIRVPSSFMENAAALKDKLTEKLSDDVKVEIIEDKLLPVDGCMIETDSRIFDCSLGTAKDTLFENMRLLALSHSKNDGEDA